MQTSSEAPEEAVINVHVRRIDTPAFFVNPNTGRRRNGTPYFHRTDDGKMLYSVLSNDTIKEYFLKAIEQGRIYVPAHIIEARKDEN